MFKRLGRAIAKPFKAGARKVVHVTSARAATKALSPLKENAMVMNWKTTFSGVAMILAVVAKIISHDFQIGAEDVATIMGGIGLLTAKDKDVTGVGDDATRKP